MKKIVMFFVIVNVLNVVVAFSFGYPLIRAYYGNGMVEYNWNSICAFMGWQAWLVISLIPSITALYFLICGIYVAVAKGNVGDDQRA